MTQYKFDLDTVKTVASSGSETITNRKVAKINGLKPCLQGYFDCYVETYYDGPTRKARLRVKDDNTIIKFVSCGGKYEYPLQEQHINVFVNVMINKFKGVIDRYSDEDYIYVEGDIIDNYTIDGKPQRYIELAYNENLGYLVE